MKIFGIFEGGGAKGLAHVGALKALESSNVEFSGIAGTSAGAIIAALIAVGYKADELFSKNQPTEVYGINFLHFFDDSLWRELQQFLKHFKELSDSSCNCEALITLIMMLFKDRKIIGRFKQRKGIFTTEKFETYLNECLTKKLKSKGYNLSGKVKFKDIDIPLKILSTDVINKKIVIFSKELCPEFEVAKAVAASINLPIIFEPYKINLSSFEIKPESITDSIELIDGGLLSNFPAWLFDDERAELGPEIPTIGFRLVEKQTRHQTHELNLKDYSQNVIRTVLSGDPILETRAIENLHEIPLSVSYGTLDFHMEADSKRQLFNEGYQSALTGLKSPQFPKDRTKIEEVLKEIRSDFRDYFDVADEFVVRANVVIKTSKNTLRVMYTSGMEGDTDDNLMFPLGSGACGQAYTSSRMIICDLEAAKQDFALKWQMTKYQQALVRKDIKTLVSCPVFMPVDGKEVTLGILNIDTDAVMASSLAQDYEDVLLVFRNWCTLMRNALCL